MLKLLYNSIQERRSWPNVQPRKTYHVIMSGSPRDGVLGLVPLSVVMTRVSVFQRASFTCQSRRELLAYKRRGSLIHCCYERHLSNSNVPGKTSSNSASWRVKLSVSSLLRAAASTTLSNRHQSELRREVSDGPSRLLRGLLYIAEMSFCWSP